MRRNGYTLLEATVTIGCCSVLLGMVGAMLHIVRQVDRNFVEQQEFLYASGRLGLQFREDIRDAVNVPRIDSDEDDRFLTIDLGTDRSVIYRSTADGITRTDSIKGQTAHRELFRLPGGTPVDWTVQAERPQPMVRLELQPPPEARRGARIGRTVSVHAAVGENRRFLAE